MALRELRIYQEDGCSTSNVCDLLDVYNRELSCRVSCHLFLDFTQCHTARHSCIWIDLFLLLPGCSSKCIIRLGNREESPPLNLTAFLSHSHWSDFSCLLFRRVCAAINKVEPILDELLTVEAVGHPSLLSTASGIKTTASHRALTVKTGLSLLYKWISWTEHKDDHHLKPKRIKSFGSGVSVWAAKLCFMPGEGSFWRHPECACTAALIELLLTLIRGLDLISIGGVDNVLTFFFFFKLSRIYLTVLYIPAKLLHMAY